MSEEIIPTTRNYFISEGPIKCKRCGERFGWLGCEPEGDAADYHENCWQAVVDSTPKGYSKLLLEGEKIFAKIGDRLNEVSAKQIRINSCEFRRESDFKEICLALALYRRALSERGLFENDLFEKRIPFK